MGAYYQAAVTSNGKSIMYDAHYTDNGLKLMEHSYVDNSYCLSVLAKLINNPSSVVWLCDYHESDGNTSLTWEDIEEVSLPTTQDLTETTDYYVLNHTKKCYIGIPELKTRYKFNPRDDGWSINPIPILCNSDAHGMGGGDYRQEDSRRATWCGDTLEVQFTNPTDYINVTEDCLFFED